MLVNLIIGIVDPNMKGLMLLTCLLFANNLASSQNTAVMVNPNIGTLVTAYGQLNAAVTKLHVIVKLDAIPQIMETPFPSPCDYFLRARRQLNRWLIDQFAELLVEYRRLCDNYETIRTTSLSMRRILMNNQQMYMNTTQHLRPHSRPKRFIGSLVRRAFNIASRKQHKLLEHTVHNIASEMFTHEGRLQDLTYLTEINNNRIDSIINASAGYIGVMKNVTNQLEEINVRANGELIMSRHSLIWVSDTIVSGVLFNQLLISHNDVLQRRVKGLSDLAQGRLSTELVRPIELNKTLVRLQEQLHQKYPGLRLPKVDVLKYYSIDNIASYTMNDTVFLSIPVDLQMIDQTYSIYEIQTFVTPTESKLPQATIIMDYTDMIAVNTQENNYFPVTNAFLNRHCRGKRIFTCDSIITQYDMTQSPSCASAIFQNNLEDIQKLCKVGFMEISIDEDPMFLDLHNSSVLLVNPARKDIYSKCGAYSRKQLITNNALTTIKMKCFCLLFNAKVRSAIFAEPNCMDQTQLDIHTNDHINTLFIAHMLNKSLSQINTLINISEYKHLPPIQIPEYVQAITIPRSKHGPIYDLQKVTSLHKSDYINSLYGQVTENSKSLRYMHVLKLLFYIVCVIVFIIIIGIILLTCKVKVLTQLTAIGKLIKPVSTLPINSDTNQSNIESTLQLSWEIMITIIMIIVIIYWIIKHIHLLKIMYKYSCIPCKDLSLSQQSNKQHVLLYLSTITNYCYLDIDYINANPHDISVVQSSTPVSIELHEGFCSTYITLTHTNLGIKVGLDNTNTWSLHNTIPVPAYSKSLIRSILSQQYKAEILIGSDNVYRSFAIKLPVHAQ